MPGGSNGQKSFDEEVHGHGGISLFHFGHPGLAGIELPGQFHLGQAAPFTSLCDGLAEGQFQIDVGGCLRAESKEILGVANPVILGFKPALLSCILCSNSLFDSHDAQSHLNALGRRLREARLDRNETQRDFAARLGISIPTLRKLELGVPTVSIGLWAEAL